MPERTFDCEFCGGRVTTNDPRKRYCSKKHADRSRNLTVPTFYVGGPVEDLTKFGKLSNQEKASVLLGEHGHSIVSFDIEATHLKPNVGRILCCSFKPLGGEVYTYTGHERRFMKPDVYDDGELAAAIRDELEKADIIVGWNSKNFDAKFINSRNIHAGQRTKVAQYHVDGMWSWRSKFNAWSGLDAAQRFAVSDSENKTSVEWEQWMRAIGWDKAKRDSAMAEIVEHCEIDVRVLEQVYVSLVKAGAIRSIRRDGGIL